jgi:hypothetical protein
MGLLLKMANPKDGRCRAMRNNPLLNGSFISEDARVELQPRRLECEVFVERRPDQSIDPTGNSHKRFSRRTQMFEGLTRHAQSIGLLPSHNSPLIFSYRCKQFK